MAISIVFLFENPLKCNMPEWIPPYNLFSNKNNNNDNNWHTDTINDSKNNTSILEGLWYSDQSSRADSMLIRKKENRCIILNFTIRYDAQKE